ncbi:MAG: histidine phosphatase family protein [Clostridium sp.]|nr:histidine phosphatase family protein [Acetatifactor muris]MCM1527232.1 histidine phosphatase family protein [Bacteroides sp.]MCM1563073.1 histidine phosphatase family protein [Clostridium sp.]
MRNRAEDQMNARQITVAWIRHGETPSNREGRYLGAKDESLSESGAAALSADRNRMRYPQIQYLFTSPMRRCVETAKILYPELRPIVIPEWTETDFGRFENKTYDELKEDLCYRAWLDSGGTADIPGGESRAHFILRCRAGMAGMYGELMRMAEGSGNEPIRAGAIVHGGTIMALLASLSGEDYYEHQAPCGGGYLCRMEGPCDQEMRIRIVNRL